MGMDVSGKNPDAPVGEYFRANVWSWRPIHQLMCKLCGDLLSEGLLEQMSYNDGAGPDDQETCTQMAIRFSQWLEKNHNGHAVDLGCYCAEGTGRFVGDEELARGDPVETAHRTSDAHLKSWVQFLLHCGGFAVD